MLLTTYFHEFQHLPTKITTYFHEFQHLPTKIITYFHECQHLSTKIATSNIYIYIYIIIIPCLKGWSHIHISCLARRTRAPPRVSIIAKRELNFRKRPSQNTALQLTMCHKPNAFDYLFFMNFSTSLLKSLLIFMNFNTSLLKSLLPTYIHIYYYHTLFKRLISYTY